MARPSSVPGTRPRRSGDRRSALLAIAAQLFARRGYTQTTVRDIADEAGILSGSLYYHFPSKEAIFSEIMRGFMGELQDRFRQVVDGDAAPPQQLDSLIRGALETIASHPAEVALYQNESAHLANESGFEFVGEASAQIEQIWLQVIRAGQNSGGFRPDLDAGLTYRFIRDAVWQTVAWYRPRGRLGLDDIAEQYLALLHGGLVTPAPAPPDGAAHAGPAPS